MKYSFLLFYFLERMCGHIDQIDSVVHFERRQMLDNWDITSITFTSKMESQEYVEPALVV